MDEAQFWKIIDTAWSSTDKLKSFQNAILKTIESAEAKAAFEESIEDYPEVPNAFIPAVTKLLEELNQAELMKFDNILERKLYDIDREEIHEYTDGSDDGFLYCRGFIVAMGQTYYDAVNTTPSNAMFDWECEEFCYISAHLCDKKFGEFPQTEISRETGNNPEGW